MNEENKMNNTNNTNNTNKTKRPKRIKPNAFLSIVKERPDLNLSVEYPYCPYCKNRNKETLEQTSHSMTCVGGPPGRDPNHHHRLFHCGACRKEFYMENHGSMVWYTEPSTSKVLDGIPACFESYIYTCSKCDGEVYRVYRELYSDEAIVGGLHSGSDDTGKWINYYHTFFCCQSCGVEVENAAGYFSYEAYMPKRRGSPRTRPLSLKKGWIIKEEVGVVVVNDYAISNVTVPKESDDLSNVTIPKRSDDLADATALAVASAKLMPDTQKETKETKETEEKG